MQGKLTVDNEEVRECYVLSEDERAADRKARPQNDCERKWGK